MVEAEAEDSSAASDDEGDRPTLTLVPSTDADATESDGDLTSDDAAAPAARSDDGRPRHLKPRPDRHRLRLVRRVVAVKAVATTTAVAIGITAAAAATGVVVTVVDPPKWPLSADKDETTTSSTFEMPTVTLDLGRPAIPGSKPTEPEYSPTLQIACVLDFVCPDPVAVLGQEQVDAIQATVAAKTAAGVDGPASSSSGGADPSTTATTEAPSAPQEPGATTTITPPGSTAPEPPPETTTTEPPTTTTEAPPETTTTEPPTTTTETPPTSETPIDTFAAASDGLPPEG